MARGTCSTDCLNGVGRHAHALRAVRATEHGEDELLVARRGPPAGEEVEERGVGAGGVAEARAAREPLEEGERGGGVGGGAGGAAEEVGDVRGGDGGGQALVGPALVPAARGDDTAELRDDVGGGGGGGGSGSCALGEGREAPHGERQRRGLGFCDGGSV